MNKVALMGRLTRDPDIRNTPGDSSTAVARYTLAVDRRFMRKDENGNGQTADFIGCVAFGKSAEFAEKYLQQGKKIIVIGRLQTGSYINRDGQKVYTTDVVVEEQEFAESKSAESSERSAGGYQGGGRQNNHSRPVIDEAGFMNIPEGLDDDLPFD